MSDIPAVVVAAISAGFAGLSWWSSRGSVKAARESAAATRDAVRIAAEAEHEKRAPQWEELEVHPRDDGGCTIRAFYIKGPPAVNVEIGYYGWRRSGSAHGNEIAKSGHRTERHEPVARREPIELPVDPARGWDSVVELDLYVTYISKIPEETADERNWFDASHLHWRRDAQTSS